MAQGRFTKIISMIKWIQTSRSSIKNPLFAHRDIDAVELVEAPPRAGLREPFEDLAHALVVHLVAAVEDVHHHPQRPPQILSRI